MYANSPSISANTTEVRCRTEPLTNNPSGWGKAPSLKRNLYKCCFTSIFALILKVMVQIHSIFSENTSAIENHYQRHSSTRVRVCGDAVLLGFWCGFAEIFILSCGIAVLQNQAVPVFRNFQVISMQFEVLLCYSVQCLYVLSVWFCSICTPLTTPPPPWLLIMAAK